MFIVEQIHFFIHSYHLHTTFIVIHIQRNQRLPTQENLNIDQVHALSWWIGILHWICINYRSYSGWLRYVYRATLNQQHEKADVYLLAHPTSNEGQRNEEEEVFSAFNLWGRFVPPRFWPRPSGLAFSPNDRRSG